MSEFVRFTYDLEGTEGGHHHSRVPHVPSDASGVTIGRGYDMKHRPFCDVLSDLIEAGVPVNDATKLASCQGKTGKEAKRFLKASGYGEIEITPEAQEQLFINTYEEMVADVKRICNKPDCVKTYGAVDWDALHPAIREVLVDLRFRGDYTTATRLRVQPAVVMNSLEAMADVMGDRDLWKTVPKSRFGKRVGHLHAAILAEARDG